MDKAKVKEYLNYLEDKYTEWYIHPKQQSAIEAEIYKTAMRWDDEIYDFLSPNNATGLFKHGFFESDIKKAMEELRGIVDEERQKADNKMYQIYSKLLNYEASFDDVSRKELKDYLLDKIHKGDLLKGMITFRDSEDFEYFSKLTNSIGIDATALLEEIVLKAFS